MLLEPGVFLFESQGPAARGSNFVAQKAHFFTASQGTAPTICNLLPLTNDFPPSLLAHERTHPLCFSLQALNELKASKFDTAL